MFSACSDKQINNYMSIGLKCIAVHINRRDLIRTEKLNQRESKWGWLVDDYVKVRVSVKNVTFN